MSSYFENLKASFNAAFNSYIKTGQIKKVHYVDDESNISKKHPEYDVVMFDNLGGQTILRNVRSANMLSGFNDYEETILEPSEVALEGKLEDSNTPDKKNGAYVLVAFIDGNYSNPVILAGLDHPGADAEFTKEKQINRFRRFRGLEQRVNKNGELEMSFTGVKNPDGTPVNPDQTPITFKVGLDGTLTSDSGHRIIFSSGDDGDRLVIRTNRDQIFQIEDTEGQEAISVIHKSGALLTVNDVGSVQFVGANGNYLYLNSESDEVSLVQSEGNMISMIPDAITLAHKGGSDIVSIGDGQIQMSSGGSISLQPAGFGVNAGTIEMKDTLQAGLKVNNGQVALGGPAAEVLDLMDQTLTQLITLTTAMATETHIGNLGYPTAPPLNAASYAAAQAQLTIIQVLLNLIKGSL